MSTSSARTPARVSNRRRTRNNESAPEPEDEANATTTTSQEPEQPDDGHTESVKTVPTPAPSTRHTRRTHASAKVESTPNVGLGAKANADTVVSSALPQALQAIHTLINSAPRDGSDAVEIGSQLRSIQQVLLKSDGHDLIHPQLWTAFLQRLRMLQPNTVRVDLQILTAIGRTTAAILTEAKPDVFPLLSTLRQLILLLLPSSFTLVTESWSSTFRPSYGFFIGFQASLVKQTIEAIEIAPAPLIDLIATVFDAYALINSHQTTQRKAYDTALQERNLPMWSQLHYQISARQRTATKPLATSLAACATRIAQAIGSVLFNSEHLNLYADALGTTNEEEAEQDAAHLAEAEADVQNQQSHGTEDSEMKDVEGSGIAKSPDAEESQPPSKKSKVSAAKSKSTPSASASHKPHPANYTRKLFESIAQWLGKKTESGVTEERKEREEAERKASAKESKKRKHEETESEAAAPTSSESPSFPFTTPAIRSLLPILFSGYIQASQSQFHQLYPPSEREVPLTGVELRRKQSKERVKNQRELQFLQVLWTLNESATATKVDSSLPSIFSSPLTPASLPLLHDIFLTNSTLFSIISQYDIYKIHQDSNTAHAGTSAEQTWTSVKKLLADQGEKVMAVVTTMLLGQEGAAEGKKSSSKKKSPTPSTATPPFLSLGVTLLTNFSHLLQLNPEFVVKYLQPAAAESRPSIWHFVWKVAEWSAQSKEEQKSATRADMLVLSPPTSALPTARSLSQSLLSSFFKLRQYDVVFSSYLEAFRSARKFQVHPKALQTIVGASFDLSALMRNIPPLKVPSLWEWFLTQAQAQFIPSSSGEEHDQQASRAFASFFVYFLDTMLVREEIATQLSGLSTRTMTEVLSSRLRALIAAAEEFTRFKIQSSPEVKAQQRGEKKAKKQAESNGATPMETDGFAAESTSTIDAASLFLLLHSLNEVRSQCDQHTTKTYETMLSSLPPYFDVLDDASESSTSPDSIHLTNLIHHLAAEAGEDPVLLHALHQVAVQRLKQIARHQSRNILVDRFAAEDANGDVAMEDSEDSDSDEDGAKKKKVIPASKPKASSAVEAHSLTSFLLESQASCTCSLSSTPSDHASFRWDGAPSSLHEGRASAVALWKLVCENVDCISQFADQEQKNQLVTVLIDITACRHCAAEDGRKEEHPSLAKQDESESSNASAVYTLRTLTTSLLVQPWFYELKAIRTTLLDSVLSRFLLFAADLVKSAAGSSKSKSSKESASSSSSSSLRVPSTFPLTAAHAGSLVDLRAFSESFSSAGKKSAAAIAPAKPEKLWQAVWLLQLVKAWPAQYLTVNATFHALLLLILWSIECGAALIGGEQTETEPQSLKELGARQLKESDITSLASHLLLASRRVLVTSLLGLVSSPSSLAAAFSPAFAEWFAFKGLEQHRWMGRHKTMGQDATLVAIRAIAPVLLARGSAEDSKSSKPTASPFAPVMDHINRSLASSDATSLQWPLALSSSIVASFLLGWTDANSSSNEIAKAFKQQAKETGVEKIFAGWLGTIQNTLYKQASFSSSSPLLNRILSLHAPLLVAAFCGRKDSDAQLGSEVIKGLTERLSSVLEVLTSLNEPADLHQGAYFFLHALCFIQPSIDTAMTTQTLFRGLLSALAANIHKRLEKSNELSSIVSTVRAAFVALLTGASSENAESSISELIDQLDPAAATSDELTEVRATQSAALHLLQSFLTHTFSTSSHRRAINASKLALLYFRLARLTGEWSSDVLAKANATGCLSLLSQVLLLLAQVLNRPQTYALDDQSLSLLVYSLLHPSAILRIAAETDRNTASTDSSLVEVGKLYHPLYLVLYGLVKHHASSLVKVVPVYLNLLRVLLAWQWRQVQSADASHPLPILTSENLARLLEEIGRTSNAKLFNKYLVGLILDWTQISKHKGALWGQAQQEAHQKAINKGWFAVINLCEEHDLSYLHNLLDAAGRGIFRTLHQAYKKTRFTGMV